MMMCNASIVSSISEPKEMAIERKKRQFPIVPECIAHDGNL